MEFDAVLHSPHAVHRMVPTWSSQPVARVLIRPLFENKRTENP